MTTRSAITFAICFVGMWIVACGAMVMVEGKEMRENWKRKLENNNQRSK